MTRDARLKFGSFMSPIHSARENPTLALHRDVETIVRLEELSYDEAWIGDTLERAALQLLPRDELKLVIAGTVSPNGPKLAGKFGKSLLAMTATTEAGFNVLADHWGVVQEQSELHGQAADRSLWRMVGPIYVAETEEQTLADMQRGLDQWCYYMSVVGGLPLLPKSAGAGNCAKGLVDAGFAVIGTPVQAIEQISRLHDQSGGFGTFLIWANDWAPQHKMLQSYVLFAREVMPTFDGSTQPLLDAEEWAISRKADLDPAMKAAREAARTQYDVERAVRTIGS